MRLLPEPYGWGSRPMGREWMEPYRAIAEAAVACLEEDGRYFLRAAARSALLSQSGFAWPELRIASLMVFASSGGKRTEKTSIALLDCHAC